MNITRTRDVPHVASGPIARARWHEAGILRQNEPMVVVTTVVSLVLYTLAQVPQRVVTASLGVTAP
jgi:hypothetical protein